MALPKEPRQKMINIMYLVLTAILALNVSAEVIEAFKTVDKSLQSSSENLGKGTNLVYKSLSEKMNDAQYAEQAKKWVPIANTIKKESDDLNSYIENLKMDLKKESKLKEDGSFKEDALDASTRLFEQGKKGDELKAKLDAYKKKVTELDPELTTNFAANFPVNSDGVIGKEGKQKDFTASYFHMTPTVAALTILSKLQNSVKNAENQMVSYAHSKLGEVKVKFDKTGVLFGQSSNYVMPGEEITVTAGIGAYSSAAAPQISIGGAGVPVVDGQGTYKFQASGSGKQTKVVTIRYKDQNGVEKTESKNVEYTVGTPGGAAVMLDKMNVFYIGVDNPVTIGSPTGWDKTQVGMTGGTISQTGGSARTVRVSALGKATINVTANGKTSSFDFRVKRIPDPVFKVGDGKIRMASIAFKSQTSCRADLENFDFDLRYSVVSATVYFSGANFPNVVTASISGNSLAPLASFMQRCGPGSVISFDNIKVSGPDGTRSIDGKSIALY
jgi:gliding motility-associated protein GldM